MELSIVACMFVTIGTPPWQVVSNIWNSEDDLGGVSINCCITRHKTQLKVLYE